jgi:hypothetical protein
MRLNLHLESHAGMLIASISGERPAHDDDALEGFIEMWGRVADYCRDHDVRKVLTLVSVAGEGSSLLVLKFFLQLESFGYERCIRTAIVYPTPRRRRVNQIGIGIALRRGWDMRSFDEELLARQWLGNEPS